MPAAIYRKERASAKIWLSLGRAPPFRRRQAAKFPRVAAAITAAELLHGDPRPCPPPPCPRPTPVLLRRPDLGTLALARRRHGNR